MIKLYIIAEVHDVPFEEITDGTTVNANLDSVAKTIEWPVVPRVGEWFDCNSEQGVIGRVTSVWHYRNQEGEPEIQIFCLVDEQDIKNLVRAGWKNTGSDEP